MHRTTGRWGFGLVLAFLTALQWGVLPIALKVVLSGMDPYTVTWYRLMTSAFLLFLYMLWRRSLPDIRLLKGTIFLLMVIAVTFLCGNYITYLIGLDHVTPSVAATVVQLAPLFLLVGSMLVFKERFNQWQWTGFVLLLIGMALFFNDRLDQLFHHITTYSAGVIFVVVSAILWAVYALAQKQLLETFSSESVMLFVYWGGTLLFFPVSHPGRLTSLSHLELALLLFCAVNTLTAYGCFAEAMDHLDASRVSAVLTLIPLITASSMALCGIFFPGFITPEHLNTLSIVGIFLVTGGAMMCSLSRNNDRAVVK